ncbi:hypothetical protein ACQ4PT_010013 [Festuca glaucescens]
MMMIKVHGGMASSSSVSSWRVTYALRPFASGGRNHPFLDGVLIIHHAKGHLLLLDRSEFVVDSRNLGERESIGFGGPVALPRHDVRIPPRPLPPSSLFGTAAPHGRRQSGGGAIPIRASASTRSASAFPSSIEDLFYSIAPTRAQRRPSSPEPPRPRGGHAIDPGRWSTHGLLGASPSSNMAGGPGSGAGLGSSPAVTASMAAMEGDCHTCPEPNPPPSIVNGDLRQAGPGNPSSYKSPGGGAAACFDLDLILGHFWDESRVPTHSPPRAPDTFGWWRGKVAGDPRSFAQVAASPPSMGDGGGRFAGGRGRNQPNRGRGRNVWQREDAAQTSSTNLRGSNSHSQQSNDRWEAAAWESEKRRQEASSTAGGNTGATQGAGASSLMAAGDPIPCLNCKIAGHYTARCPTIRCDRCKKLGHIAQICQIILPWECAPSMCGFQAPGRGFFYMPDQSSSKLIKERATSVVITIIEGNATCREIEQSFNIIFGDSWRCTARAIGPNQYTMRFPTPCEVERAVCYGASMKLKTADATVSLSPWTASVGAKAQLQKAWVKISNIPLDKRCEANVFYAGGLIGVSLDLEASTLHKPEYVKVLIGCRDIEMIPPSAEGCLGDNFYDFYYEVDKIVVGRAPRDTTNVAVGNSGAPSPKRQRFEQY